MKLQKEKYLPQIEQRKFRRASIFRQSYLVVNGIKTKVVCNHVASKSIFNEYVKGMNEINANQCYLVPPLIKVDLSDNCFDVFDLLIVSTDMHIKKIYVNRNNIDLDELYFAGVLLLQKNSRQKIGITEGSKINFRRV